MCVLVALCVCAFVLSARGCCVSALLFSYELYVSPKFYLSRSHASSAERVRFCSALVMYSKELAVIGLGCYLY